MQRTSSENVDSNQHIVFDTTDKRFKNKGLGTYIHQHGTNKNVGPGSYMNAENSMVKKTFNMSMEQRNPPFVK